MVRPQHSLPEPRGVLRQLDRAVEIPSHLRDLAQSQVEIGQRGVIRTGLAEQELEASIQQRLGAIGASKLDLDRRESGERCHQPRVVITKGLFLDLEGAFESRRRLVQDKIAELPEAYRMILQLRDIEGWSTREVAEALALSEANTKVRLHRARSALKKLLEPLLRGEVE